MDHDEEIFDEFRPGFLADKDTAWLNDFAEIQRRHEPEISAWAQAFLDYHPVDHQRTAAAIKAWADQVPWPEGEYGREMMALAVRMAITMRLSLSIAAERDRARRTDLMQAAHERIVEARKKAAVYDGVVDRARPAYYVGVGWHAILDDLIKEFSEIDGLGFLSAHEKFGGLRISYLYSGDRQADIDAIEKRAIERSLITCWYCGQPGKLKRERWWRVRCEEHWSAEND
ncbi:hypothetical protein U8C31_18195 [Sinorhizobium medicae]|uniref:hypothetical protein n=1 Tax=Sinorhizobium medicae TaxID=110321 RepID=UPI002AF6B6FB|nr:hypothetical protein [Sinorhizobium medicae]WQO72168.1 hypothetical protein U8C31_18195 [Sinorhizobium medicae]